MVHLADGTIVSHRNDGMGARLIAALNAIRIAKTYDLPWHICWTTHGMTRPELQNPSDLFSEPFVEQCLSDHDLMSEVQERATDLTTLASDLTRDGFLNLARQGATFLSALPMGVVTLPWEDEEEIRLALPDCLNSFKFSSDVQAMMTRIDAAFEGAALSAFHIRRGDIIHHPVASNKLWPSKYAPREYYEVHLERLLEIPAARILVFSDTPEEVARLKKVDARVQSFDDLVGQAELTVSGRDFLELYAMSRCKRIYGPPSSAFSQTAALIGGGSVEAVDEALAPEDCIRAMEIMTDRLEAKSDLFLNFGDVGQSLHFMVCHLRGTGQIDRAKRIIEAYISDGLDKAYVYQLLNELTVLSGDLSGLQRARKLAYAKPAYVQEAVHLVNTYSGLGHLVEDRKNQAMKRILTANWVAPIEPLSMGVQNIALSGGVLGPDNFYPFDPRLKRRLSTFFPRRKSRLNDLNIVAGQYLGPDAEWMGYPWEIVTRDWQFLSGKRLNRAFSNNSKIRKARRTFEKDYHSLKDTPVFESTLGVFLRALGDTESAVELQRSARWAEPENALFRKRLSDTLYARQNPEMGLRQLRAAAELSPEHPCYQAELVYRLTQAGLRDEASQIIDQLFNKKHDYVEIHFFLSEILRRVPSTREKALASLERSLSPTHGSPRLMQAQGRLLMQLGRIDEAYAVYAKMVDWRLSTEITHVQIYRLFEDAGREDMARDLTQKSEFDFETVKSRAHEAQTPVKPKSSNIAGSRAHKMDHKDVIRRQVLKELGDVKTIIEIGVWRGRFSEVLLQEIKPEKLYLVDPWVSTHENDGDDALTDQKNAAEMEEIFNAVQSRFSKQIDLGQVEIIRDISENGLGRFENGSIDMVYIDGDHSYDGVMIDLALSYQKVRVGGFIMLDDYHRRGWWGDDVLLAVHKFIGQHEKSIRIHSVIGAQIALEKLA